MLERIYKGYTLSKHWPLGTVEKRNKCPKKDKYLVIKCPRNHPRFSTSVQ